MDQETTVAKAQDDILHDNLPIAIGMAVGVASLFAYVFLDARGIIPWLLYMITVFALRWASSLIGWRNSSDADHRSWRRIYGLGAVMTALGWSAASPLFILKADVPHQAFGILLLVGTAAGAVPVMSAAQNKFRVYAYLIILPLDQIGFEIGKIGC